MVFNATLVSLHHDCVFLQIDIANVVNYVLCTMMFEELQALDVTLFNFFFIHKLYAFEPPLFYTHHNP
jgi:hypothetical protein